jgi:hypothetical protein
MKWPKNGFVEMGFFRGRRKWRWDGRIFNRGEGREGWRKWEKREMKKGKREKEIVKKKKKTLKSGRLKDFFYSMKSYNSFLFVKSYCNILII